MDIRVAAELACTLEAMARKPGNVHPAASFHDVSVADFVAAGVAIGPAVASAREVGIGRAILDAVEATQRYCGSNINLGIILLLAPLASAEEPITSASVQEVLQRLSVEDARLAYEAIRKSRAAGLGEVEEADVHEEPTITLLEAMRLAADRDSIARQYVTGFADVFEIGVRTLTTGIRTGRSLEESIVWSQLRFMARHPDSLIARKCGLAVAEEVQQRVKKLLQALTPSSPPLIRRGFLGLSDTIAFDLWLRDERNTRNPGTSADLVAASLFVALRNDELGERDRLPNWTS